MPVCFSSSTCLCFLLACYATCVAVHFLLLRTDVYSTNREPSSGLLNSYAYGFSGVCSLILCREHLLFCCSPVYHRLPPAYASRTTLADSAPY